MLIRMAKHRYYKVTKIVNVAFKRFMDEVVLPFYKSDFFSWLNFRQQFLWCLEIDDLFKANQDEINHLWIKYSTLTSQKKRYIIQNSTSPPEILIAEDCYKMIEDAGIDLDRQEVKAAFAMSKQTVIKDSDEKGQLILSRMVHCEFYEFIGRIAMMLFDKSEMHEISLRDKICNVLDDLFAAIGQTRKEVSHEVDMSESDEDY